MTASMLSIQKPALTLRQKLMRVVLILSGLLPLIAYSSTLVDLYYRPMEVNSPRHSISPDGRHVVTSIFPVRRDHRYAPDITLQLYKTNAPEDPPTQIHLGDTGLSYADDPWAPDSKRLLLVHSIKHDKARLEVLDISSRRKTSIGESRVGPARSWLSNNRITYMNMQGERVIVNADGREIANLGQSIGVIIGYSDSVMVCTTLDSLGRRGVSIYTLDGILRSQADGLTGIAPTYLTGSDIPILARRPQGKWGMAYNEGRAAFLTRHIANQDTMHALVVLDTNGSRRLIPSLPLSVAVFGWRSDTDEILLIDTSTGNVEAVSYEDGSTRPIIDLAKKNRDVSFWTGRLFTDTTMAFKGFGQNQEQGHQVFLPDKGYIRGKVETTFIVNNSRRIVKSFSEPLIYFSPKAHLAFIMKFLKPENEVAPSGFTVSADPFIGTLDQLRYSGFIRDVSFSTEGRWGVLMTGNDRTVTGIDIPKMRLFDARSGELEHTWDILSEKRTLSTMFSQVEWPATLAILFTLYLGGFVYRQHPENTIHRLFFLFNILLASIFLILISRHVNLFYFARSFYSAGILYALPLIGFSLFPAVFLHLFLVFPVRTQGSILQTALVGRTMTPDTHEKITKVLRAMRFLIYLPSVILLVGMIHPGTLIYYLFKEDMGIPDTFDNFRPSPSLNIALGFVIIGYVLLALYNLNRFYITTKSKQTRRQIGLIVSGTTISMILCGIPIFYSINIGVYFSYNDYLILGLLLIPLSCGYAIIKHKMLDVELIIRKGLLYGGLTVMLGASSVGLILLITTLFQGLVQSTDPIVVAPTTMVIAAAFIPLRNRIQELIDRRFFREKIDYRETFSRLADQLPSVRDLTTVTRHLVDTVDGTLHLERTVLLQPGEDGTVTAIYATPDRPEGMEMASDHALVQQLTAQASILYLADEQVTRHLPPEAVQQAAAWHLDLFMALRSVPRSRNCRSAPMTGSCLPRWPDRLRWRWRMPGSTRRRWIRSG